MNIPEEAIEVAAAELYAIKVRRSRTAMTCSWSALDESTKAYERFPARAALEAAYPYLIDVRD